MRNINEIVGENTNYDEALRVTLKKISDSENWKVSLFRHKQN